MVEELLDQDHIRVLELIGTPEWVRQKSASLRSEGPEIISCSEQELRQISNLSNPNQVLAVCELPEFTPEQVDTQSGLVLFLDRIRDPGNIGTIWRIADWFGIPYLFRSPECVDPFNPKVIQASMGAFCRVRTLEINISDLKNLFPEHWVYGADMNGASLYEEKFSRRAILAIGNESYGLSKDVLNQVDRVISIPAFGNAGAESLNAAVATGIICSHFRSGRK